MQKLMRNAIDYNNYKAIEFLVSVGKECYIDKDIFGFAIPVTQAFNRGNAFRCEQSRIKDQLSNVVLKSNLIPIEIVDIITNDYLPMVVKEKIKLYDTNYQQYKRRYRAKQRKRKRMKTIYITMSIEKGVV